MKRWLIALLMLLLGRGQKPRQLPPPDRVLDAEPPRSPGSELLVVVLLLGAAAAAIVFVVVYALSANTQLLGLSMGGALVLLAAVFYVVAKRLVPQSESDEPYPQLIHQREQEEVARTFDESASRLTRKRLLVVAAGTAGTALAVAVVTPLPSTTPPPSTISTSTSAAPSLTISRVSPSRTSTKSRTTSRAPTRIAAVFPRSTATT